MRKTTTLIAIFLLAGFLLFSGFGSCNLQPNDKTPFQIAQEQVQKIMDAYIFVYDKTVFLANNPNITESEKKIVETNKHILQTVWPYLVKCIRMINANQIPDQEDIDIAETILDLVEGAIQ